MWDFFNVYFSAGLAVKIKRSLQGSPVENTHKMLRIWITITIPKFQISFPSFWRLLKLLFFDDIVNVSIRSYSDKHVCEIYVQVKVCKLLLCFILLNDQHLNTIFPVVGGYRDWISSGGTVRGGGLWLEKFLWLAIKHHCFLFYLLKSNPWPIKFCHSDHQPHPTALNSQEIDQPNCVCYCCNHLEPLRPPEGPPRAPKVVKCAQYLCIMLMWTVLVCFGSIFRGFVRQFKDGIIEKSPFFACSI